MRKKKILILSGGISKEREISLETAKQVNNTLKKKYLTLLSEPNDSLNKNIKKMEKITEEHLICKRPATGISPIDWEKIIGMQVDKLNRWTMNAAIGPFGLVYSLN